MTYCASCGYNLAEGTAFCLSCGASQNAASSAGLTNNAAGALAYLAGIFTGIIFLVLDPYKSDCFVRFHAIQCILFNIAWIASWFLWGVVSVFFGVFAHGFIGVAIFPGYILLCLGGFILWIYLMYSAYKGEIFYIPILGNIAAKQAGLPA